MDKEWRKTLEDGTEVTRTCAWSPPGCHPTGCGLKLHVKDGKLVKVEGDEDHSVTNGRLCVRCLTLPEYVNHPDRILYPMKRAKEDRGLDKWERITWDEAYDIIADNVAMVKEKYGPEGICTFQGTGRMSTIQGNIIGEMALGTPNQCYAQSGWSCYGPRMAVTACIAGCGILEIDWAGAFPERYDDPSYVLPKYCLLWGKNPLPSNPDGMYGHALIDMMKRGTKIIMADPRMNWLACHSEYVMRLRPGSDVALLMGLLRVIIEEDLYDHEFVEKWVYGWDEFVERVMTFDLDWVAETTWVPRETFTAVARILGTEKPTTIGWGLAVDQNTNGVQIAQCIMALAAITGNLDAPGGTTLGKTTGVRTATVCMPEKAGGDPYRLPDDLKAKRIGMDEFPGLTTILPTVAPDSLLDTLETDEPYPIRMAFISSSNLIAPTCSAQPKRWHDALLKMDFVAATDIFMNPTIMAVADVFLPLATFAEQDAFVITNYGQNVAFVGAINKALEMGEAKSEYQIGFDLVQRLNPELDTWKTVDEFLEWAFEEAGFSFDDLREMSIYQPGFDYYKYEKGMLRPDGQPGFNTATGRLELYSLAYQSFGDDPLPYYIEPHYSQLSKPELAEEYPLVLTTGARRYTSFHSEHRQIQTLRKLTPEPFVEIHPDTAAEHGIKEGDWVVVENMFGKARLMATLTPMVMPQVVNADHGFWFPEEDPEEPSLFGNWRSNVNSLIPHKDVGKMGFGAPYKGIMCKISKETE